ncbi:MAG: hypothetical protein ACTTKO_05425 [Candidatus Limimorpha sp.]
MAQKTPCRNLVPLRHGEDLDLRFFSLRQTPTLDEENPSVFNSTARQRILKQCFSPLRYPFSSSARCASSNSIRATFISDVSTSQ